MGHVLLGLLPVLAVLLLLLVLFFLRGGCHRPTMVHEVGGAFRGGGLARSVWFGLCGQRRAQERKRHGSSVKTRRLFVGSRVGSGGRVVMVVDSCAGGTRRRELTSSSSSAAAASADS